MLVTSTPKTMTTKLPVRRNIEPLLKIAEKLESQLGQSLKQKNDTKLKQFGANFNGANEIKVIDNVKHNDQDYERVTKKNWKSLVVFWLNFLI